MSVSSLPTYYMRSNDPPPVFPDSWKRPQIVGKPGLDFCLIDLDYRIQSTPNFKYDTRKEGEVAVVDIHGCDNEGHSILCHVHGVIPYFYTSIPYNFTAEGLEELKNKLNSALSPFNKGNLVVYSCEFVEKRNIYGFTKEAKSRYVKVCTTLPKHVASCRRVLESNQIQLSCSPSYSFQTFESNVDFIIRYMDDVGITGCSWLKLEAQNYDIRRVNDRRSINQFEIDCNYNSIIPLGTECEYMKIPPMRILSFDIEVGGSPENFPTADNDPVIQICCYVAVQGEEHSRFSAAFILNTCTPIVGSALFQFENEKDLLINFQRFIQWVDPEIITGYNICGFDIPYLVERSIAIKANEFCELGRYVKEFSTCKETTKGTKQLGYRETKDVDINGRIQYDMMIAIKNDFKLRSYSLNAVSAQFIGDQKEDVHYSMISKLQNGSDTDRHRLAIYCVKDAYLPLQLMNKLLSVLTTIELSRVCHVPVNYVLNRGQQIRVFSQILYKSVRRNLIIPALTSQKSDDQYQGATVIEPSTGYYTTPIPTLDFNSLYPSIMIGHNICYSTLMTKPDPNVQYEKSPNHCFFAKHDEFPGVLPEILKELLAARKATKKLMEEATDPMQKKVFDKRQLALKISANSVYGFTGATVGKLPCLQISESVTAYGRSMIEMTKELVENKYNKQNGYSDDAHVIYGDTDSVMVNFGNITLEEAIKRGKEAANYVSDHFPPPIHIDFEKAYKPYLLISKKHYAGLLWTNHIKYDKIDAKGIEAVRRDNCRLVQGLVQKVLTLLLVKEDPGSAKVFVKKIVSDLVSDHIDLSFLVISKGLSKKADQYKGKQAHVELADRMMKRDPGSAPRMGDRIPFVMCDVGNGAKGYEKSEDPIWALEHSIPIDTKYYLENQLSGPLNRLFGPIIGEEKVKGLLEGKHTLDKRKTPMRIDESEKAKKGSLFAFVKVSKKCVCGRAAVADGKKPTCSQCDSRIREVYQEKMNLIRYTEEEFSKLWTYCQRCQNSLTNENICSSRDCPIFYRRKKVQLELEDTHKLLARFDDMIPFL
ncbi:polymerase zeta subunit, putative [Trichomonas vaginalis G3]|uniref:DNA polymerase n=1 Tax=Trichomonas vaginalis (strain ATCC PRA-98 / G3) TaxID=412133 RepID=A2DY14_TRIV3|nr:DNA polymerase catalytic subunit family [Trichomonas vaginalis G3]EAY14750.1 polymerase zeta subunit, putative [Trichomonas vaginalis G3]KAI5487879.1 DNA polymerase catalytic subunit family [Trichomonas vaginalis G3]|eukprot:XP_001326973.1 polymerase zeta subunit [Trichomonas vaginalis G3]